MELNVFEPIFLSLKIGLISTVFSAFFGIFFAYFLYDKNGIIKNLIETIIILPMILPPTIVGYFLLLLFGSNGILGEFLRHVFHTSIIFTWYAGILSSTIVSIPLMYQNAKSGFIGINNVYKDVASTLGLGKIKIFFKIEIPLAFPSLVSGIVLSFARSIGEFGSTLMLCGNIPGKTQTISTAIFFAVENGKYSIANFLLFIMIIFSFFIILYLNIFLKKKIKNTY